MAAGQVVAGVGDDVAVPQLNVGSHGAEALEVLVNGAVGEIAAAGQGDTGGAEAAQLRADEIVGRAEAANQLDGGGNVADVGVVDLDAVGGQAADGRAHIAEDIEQEPDIGDIGDVVEVADAVNKQGGRQDGDRGVFGSGDIDGTLERHAALNQIFDHIKKPSFDPVCAKKRKKANVIYTIG